MTFDVAEAWPDKSAEYKAIADAAKKAAEEGKPGVKVTLFEISGPGDENPTEEDLETMCLNLRSRIAKFGRFDVMRVGAAAFVRVSTGASRQAKKTAAGKQ